MSGVGWEAREGRVGAPASSTGSRRGANWSVESERGLQDRYDRGRNVLLSVMSRVKQSAAVLALLTGQLIGRRRWGQLNMEGGARSDFGVALSAGSTSRGLAFSRPRNTRA